jgi:peptidoglycan/xylan/chitin deacetylase (PgdA/CDA1 family)
MKAPKLLVTTSWDDGHLLDLRIGELLERYGLQGTFYIAPRSVELPAGLRLPPGEIRQLAARFEVGGHTLSHPRLPSLDLAEASAEIRDGKGELESIIGSPLSSFAYPGGEYDERHVALVRDAGFRIGRTVQRFCTAVPHDLLQLHTTVHGYRHWKDLPAIRRSSPRRPGRAAARFWNWDTLAIDLFDRALSDGGVFHLWGHSWEIEAHRDWSRLERVLDHMAGRPDATYITNGALVAISDQAVEAA